MSLEAAARGPLYLLTPTEPLVPVIDAYIIYAASALAASAVIRTLVGAAFPLLAM